MYQILAYIKFLWTSTNQHGVHSPFVFDLITKCLYDDREYEAYAEIKNYRKALIQDNTEVTVTDFGAGSRATKFNPSTSRSIKQFSRTTNERLKFQNPNPKSQTSLPTGRIQKIKNNESVGELKLQTIKSVAKSAGSSTSQAKLLYRLVRYFKPDSILELGTSLGLGTYAMHLAKPEASIVTIEGSENLSHYASHSISSKKNTIEYKIGPFTQHLTQLKTEHWDMVFFDGDHTKKGTLTYFDLLLETTTNDTVFIFDDIHWSKGMVEAWEQIKQHPKVTVTIDIFYKGLVFFRQEQRKEHFVVRV